MNSQAVGSLLVALQFGILLALSWLTAMRLMLAALPPLSWGLGLAGLALASWALAVNRPGNFNIRPLPKSGGVLVVWGPYRWIRHPMYTALLLLGAGCAGFLDSVAGWGLWAALAGVLLVKSRLEEAWMLTAHSGYAAYRARTRRFVPGLF